MELRLYTTNDDENVINKDLTLQNTINIKLKDNVDIISPIIILKDDGNLKLLGSNYCYLEELKRFYFIRDVELMNADMFRLVLECDVIESFKNDILNSQCNYSRKVEDGDFTDFSHGLDLRKVIDIYSGDVELNPEKNIILSSIGGAI